MSPYHDDLLQRIERELLYSHDGELELEIEDRDLPESFDGADATQSPNDKQARLTYIRELFRVQGELVKLQDWVAHEKQEAVILFERRDAAGVRSRPRSSCPSATDRLEGDLPARKCTHLQDHHLYFDNSITIET